MSSGGVMEIDAQVKRKAILMINILICKSR